MDSITRTTISFPSDVYSLLQLSALKQKTSIAAIVNESVREKLKTRSVLPGEGIAKFLSLSKKIKTKKSYTFNRKTFYDEQLKHKMSFGY